MKILNTEHSEKEDIFIFNRNDKSKSKDKLKRKIAGRSSFLSSELNRRLNLPAVKRSLNITTVTFACNLTVTFTYIVIYMQI